MVRTSSASLASPEPSPPIVNDGRMTTGLPTVAANAIASSSVWQTSDAGVSAADRAHDLLEPLAVLAALDRVDVGADELDVVLARAPRSSCSATARLSAVCPPRVGSSASGRSLRDHLLDELGGDRLDVGGVGELRVGHDRGRVGVDQADPEALGPQHAAGLGAGVVELAGLADDDRPGADDQDVLDVGALRHQWCPPPRRSRAARRIGRTGTRRRAGRPRPPGGTAR